MIGALAVIAAGVSLIKRRTGAMSEVMLKPSYDSGASGKGGGKGARSVRAQSKGGGGALVDRESSSNV